MEIEKVTFSSTEPNEGEPNSYVLCFVSFKLFTKGHRQYAINTGGMKNLMEGCCACPDVSGL